MYELCFKRDTTPTPACLVCTVKETHQGKKAHILVIGTREKCYVFYLVKLKKKIQIHTRRCNDAVAAISERQLSPFTI